MQFRYCLENEFNSLSCFVFDSDCVPEEQLLYHVLERLAWQPLASNALKSPSTQITITTSHLYSLFLLAQSVHVISFCLDVFFLTS